MTVLNPDQLMWFNALTSGWYDQGTGVMKRVQDDKSEYCCMGVACEVLEPAVLEQDDTSTSMIASLGFRISDEGVQHTYLPPSLNERLGLTEEDNEMLAQLNDSYLFTFKEIARVLLAVWETGRSVRQVHKGLTDWQHIMFSLRGLES